MKLFWYLLACSNINYIIPNLQDNERIQDMEAETAWIEEKQTSVRQNIEVKKSQI